jgi:hypothetical protein
METYSVSRTIKLGLLTNTADASMLMLQTGGLQSQVNVQPGVGIEGDFASNNPRATVNIGAGGLVTGPAGATVGRFVWPTGPFDPDNTPIQVANNYSGFGIPSNVLTGGVSGQANIPLGFLSRRQEGIITQYLQDATLLIPQGFQVHVFSEGDFWVKNNGTSQSQLGQKAYANLSTGAVSFGPTGQPTQSASITAVITPALSTFTASIAGNIMTVTAMTSGTLSPGTTLTGTSGTISANTAITAQLSGSAGAVGIYALNIGEQTYPSVASGLAVATVSGSVGLMNVTAVASGTLGIGQTVVGTGVALATTIQATSLTNPGLGLTGAGNTGTYFVSPSETDSSSADTTTGNVETKWFAASQGNAGELVKITSRLYG